MTTTFTCFSCRVVFKDFELQRLHYKTDWHRYNLKRKVAELPPVTAESFQQRVQNQRNHDASLAEDKHVYCGVCRKSFGNDRAYTNHVQSKKHQQRETMAAERGPMEEDELEEEVEEEDVEEVDSDEWNEDEENPIDDNNCLFCLHHSGSLVKNVQHMTEAHTFFVPDVEYCVDLEGLLRYLGEKVAQGYMCLWCNDKGKTFHTADAARQHMLDKGHCKMLHEGLALAEYADFYDYSASYPDNNNENGDEEVAAPELLDDSDYQLVLPSGVTVGHRSLMRYYRQKLNPNAVVVPKAKGTKRLHRVLAEYRALGWTETQQAAAAKKARDLHFMKRVQAKWNLKMGRKGNSIKQAHFRVQVNF